MKLEKKFGYTVVSDFKALVSLLSERAAIEAALKQNETAIAVFMPDGTPEGAGADKMAELYEYLRSLPAVTILAAENAAELTMEQLMLFDIRLGAKQFMINGCETGTVMDIRERYKVICGENADYRLECYLSGEKSEPFDSGLIRILGGEMPFNEAVEEYMETNLKEKPEFQIAAIAQCLIKARGGDCRAVLTEESVQFYRLIRKKGEECANGTE